MNKNLKQKLFVEFAWLLGILVVSAAIEYVIITLFDLHPILSVKVQGFIGLVIVAYGIRMLARMGDQGLIEFVDEDEELTDQDEHH
jgi:hypothetical protein